MDVSCAWCRRTIASASTPGSVSHGICAECLNDLESRAGSSSNLLETFAGAVMLVDLEGRALGANSRLADVVHRPHSSVPQLLIGDVISCLNAPLPGGCGRTPQCSRCEIRQAVDRTRSSGTSSTGVTAYATVSSPDGPALHRLSLSLEPVGADAVLIRIDALESQPIPTDAAATATVPRTRLKVLVADDDEPVRRFVAGALRGAGCEVLEACDGREATRLVNAHNLDVLITDLVMPVQEGLETTRTLRRQFPALGIIAMSGAFTGLMLEAARHLGADATLEKPFTARQVIDAVRQVASSRRAR
jgi:CheY-like chemotaxis protein